MKTKFWAVIETKQNGKLIKERSQEFDSPLKSEGWLHTACKEARDLKVKVTDHYLMSAE